MSEELHMEAGAGDEEEGKPVLERLSAFYSQEEDCNGRCGHDFQHIEISTEDGGGGKYFILKTERWSFDSAQNLLRLIADFSARVFVDSE